MHEALIRHIEKFITLEASEIYILESCFQLSKIKKKEHLLKEGQVWNTMYFVVKGCMRQYIINTKGSEQTLQFSIENWWITDLLSYHNNSPSHFYIQALENSDILLLKNKH